MNVIENLESNRIKEFLFPGLERKKENNNLMVGCRVSWKIIVTSKCCAFIAVQNKNEIRSIQIIEQFAPPPPPCRCS